MEKLMYVLWSEDTDSFPSEALTAELAPSLDATGAQRIKVLVADERVAAGAPMNIQRTQPAPRAAISFWLPSASQRQTAEQQLAGHNLQWAGFSCTESVPLCDPTMVGEDGWCQGFTQLALISPQAGMDRAPFLDEWLEAHTPIAIRTQSTCSYVQNVVNRSLNPHQRPWQGLVEESFPTAALTNRALFFDADGDQEKMAKNVKELMSSCARFLDGEAVEVLMTSEYRHGAWRDQ